MRRFSDFLWLFEALTLNNPGVIVPPVPDKHPFGGFAIASNADLTGRFQDQFVETRRLALERCLRKMCAHPVLQLDPDLKLFLESDSFSMDVSDRALPALTLQIKQRKLEMTQEKQGYLASWTGPKYFEQDEVSVLYEQADSSGSIRERSSLIRWRPSSKRLSNQLTLRQSRDWVRRSFPASPS